MVVRYIISNKLFLSFSVLLLLLSGGSASASIKIKDTIEYYSVFPVGYETPAESLLRYEGRNGCNHADALGCIKHKAKTNWTLSKKRNNCHIKRLRTNIGFIITIPKLRKGVYITDKYKSSFYPLQTFIYDHEKKHRQHTIDAYYKLHREAMKLSGKDCEVLSNKYKGLLRKISKERNQKSKELDKIEKVLVELRLRIPKKKGMPK